MNKGLFGQIMVREAGLEPARPYRTLEPESSESANSTTRAQIGANAPICILRLEINNVKYIL